MRRLLLMVLLSSILFVPVAANADWAENFDSYALGSGLHGQGGWHGWDGSATWDAYVSDAYARSAPHSVAIAATSDMVHEYSGYTSGVWVYKAWQYIPTSFAGQSYILLLNTYNDGGPYNWSTQVSFNSTTGTVVADPNGESLPLIVGQWVEIRVVIDLDANQQTFYYGNQLLFQGSWTEGMSGGGILNIAAIDLFANNAGPIYYDDLMLAPDGPVPVETTSWGQIKATFK